MITARVIKVPGPVAVVELPDNATVTDALAAAHIQYTNETLMYRQHGDAQAINVDLTHAVTDNSRLYAVKPAGSNP